MKPNPALSDFSDEWGGGAASPPSDASSATAAATTTATATQQPVRFVVIPVLTQSQKQEKLSTVGASLLQSVREVLATMADNDVRLLMEEIVRYVNDKVEREGLSPFEITRLPSAAEELPQEFPRLAAQLRGASGRHMATMLLFLLHWLNELAQDVVPLIDLDAYRSPGKLALLARRSRSLLYTQVKLALFHEELDRLPRAEQLPIIQLNRFITHQLNPPKQPGYDWECLFMQAMRQLNAVPAHMMRSPLAGWTVKFVDESSYDTGGLFRDSITQMCYDVQSSSLPLLIPSPNAVISPSAASGGGAPSTNVTTQPATLQSNASAAAGFPWIPNPNVEMQRSQKIRECFIFLGKLLAVAIQSSVPLPLQLPAIVWKLLVGDAPEIVDLREIDAYCFQCLGSSTR
jgi:hypothetical protein